MPPRWGNRGYRSRPSRSSPGQSRGPVGGSPHGRGGDGLMKKKKSKTQSVSTSDTATGKFTGGTQRPTPKPKPKPDPKPDDDKKTFVDKHKGATTLAVGSGSLLGASLGTRKYKQIQDIRKVNRWSDKVKGRFGKTYTQLGRKVNPALMARTSGQFIPSSIYAKTGHPAGISNWWNKRSSPTHFAGAEKFVNPILKASAKIASKLLWPASLLIPTPANASEDERMAIINERWNQEKNKVSEMMDESGLIIDKVQDTYESIVDNLKQGKDAAIGTLSDITTLEEKTIEKGIEKILKNEPILEYEFSVPFGGKGKVSVENSLQEGGVMLIWGLGGNK